MVVILLIVFVCGLLILSSHNIQEDPMDIKTECPTCHSMVHPQAIYWTLRTSLTTLNAHLITTQEQLSKVGKKQIELHAKLEQQLANIQTEMAAITALLSVCTEPHRTA